MRRVLVIGGTSFMGRLLVEQLLERGDDVAIMHRAEGTPFGDRVAEVKCDRNDTAAVQQALHGRTFDVVFDNVYDWQRGTSAEQVTAAAATLGSSVRRYVFTSSVAVYPAGGPYDENAPLVPDSHPEDYGRQKAQSERALFELHKRAGVPVCTLRPAFIYGPHNPFDREAFFWDRIVAGRPVIVPDDGSRTMQWVHAADVAQAAIRASENDVAIGHAYNLGNDPPVTQLEFVQALARAAGKQPDVVHVSRAQIREAGGDIFGPPLYFGVYLDIPPITVRADRIKNELGFELRPLADGLRDTFHWYQHQQRPQPDYSWEDKLIAAAQRSGHTDRQSAPRLEVP